MEPRTVHVKGPDFRTAIAVEINGVPSPSFTVASRYDIMAQVPGPVVKQNITDVNVVSSNFTATYQSLITFELSNEPRPVTGIKAMMQGFIKVLLTTPFIDSFNKFAGGGIQEIIGSNADSKIGSNVITAFTRGVSLAAEQMRAMQSRQGGLPDDEKLLAANLLGVEYNGISTGIDARVELINQAGTMALANLQM